MDSKEDKIARANELKKQIIESTMGLQFLEFEHISIVKRLPSEWEEWQDIASTPSNDTEYLVEWITKILQLEQINGQIYLMWDDREIVAK
jgi:hypothetical protein